MYSNDSVHTAQQPSVHPQFLRCFRPPARTLTLALVAASGLAACKPTPAAPKIPGATVKLQLTEQVSGVAWTYGKSTVDLQQVTQVTGEFGKVIVSADTDATGAATVALPGEGEGVLADATQPVSDIFNSVQAIFTQPSCSVSVKTSDASARVLTVAPRFFTNKDGGSALVPLQFKVGPPQSLAFQLLVFSTSQNNVNADISCDQNPLPQALKLDAGWNLVELDIFAIDDPNFSFKKLPIDTVVPALKMSN